MTVADQVPADVTREAMFSWLQEVAPYGIFTTDTDLRIRTWNQWLVAHSGLTTAEVIGRKLTEVFPTIEARRLDEHFRRALQGEISVLSTALHQFLLPLPPATREFKVPNMLQTARIAPLPEGSQISGTITLIEDVTQRECQAAILYRQQEHDRLLSTALRLLLEAEDPLDSAAELFARIAAPLGLEVCLSYLVSFSGTELHLHASTGVPPEARRLLAVQALGEGPVGEAAQRRERVLLDKISTTTGPFHEPFRRLGLRHLACFPLAIGERLLGALAVGTYQDEAFAQDRMDLIASMAQFLAVALDRGQRDAALREAQESLVRHADALETAVTERTAKLHDTIGQLESFSYTVAHDLRAPIRSLIGMSDVLIEDHGPTLPEEAQAILERISRAGRLLDALTRDLLRFSRLGRQDVDLSPVDLEALLEDIRAVSPSLQDGVLVTVPPLGAVIAQRTLLQQCLTNLFDNALKFGRSEVRPKIIVRTELRSGGSPRLRIWVEDNGIGIPPYAHEKIFGIFERLPGPVPTEGTGIGLAIVARATERMGGAYGVESVAGSGSRFWLEFAAAE